MRKLLLYILLSTPAWAQPAAVHILDTVYYSFGNPLSTAGCALQISGQSGIPAPSGGTIIFPVSYSYQVKNGVVDIWILPNAIHTTYTVESTCTLSSNSTKFTTYWYVPNTSPLTVQQVLVPAAYTPLTMINISQIMQSAATNGESICWSNSANSWLPCMINASAVQNANTVYAGPTSGAPALPQFRSLGVADVPEAATADALHAAPTVCNTGFAPVGIDVHGNALNCASTAGFQNPMTTQWDLITGLTGGAPTRLPLGSGVLQNIAGSLAYGNTVPEAVTADALHTAPSICSTGFAPVGIDVHGNALNCAASFANPMTTQWDLITGLTGGTPARLPLGSGVLQNIAGALAYGNVPAGEITAPGSTGAVPYNGGAGLAASGLSADGAGNLTGVSYTASGNITASGSVSANGFIDTSTGITHETWRDGGGNVVTASSANVWQPPTGFPSVFVCVPTGTGAIACQWQFQQFNKQVNNVTVVCDTGCANTGVSGSPYVVLATDAYLSATATAAAFLGRMPPATSSNVGSVVVLGKDDASAFNACLSPAGTDVILNNNSLSSLCADSPGAWVAGQVVAAGMWRRLDVFVIGTSGHLLALSAQGKPADSGIAANNVVTTTCTGCVNNTNLAHNSVTVNGDSCVLGATCFVSGGVHGVVFSSVCTPSPCDYPLALTDNAKDVLMICSVGVACQIDLLPTPGAAFYGRIQSVGASVATVNLNGLQWNSGASAPSLVAYRMIDFYSDGTNYFGTPPLAAGSGIQITPSSNSTMISAGSFTMEGYCNGAVATAVNTLDYLMPAGAPGNSWLCRGSTTSNPAQSSVVGIPVPLAAGCTVRQIYAFAGAAGLATDSGTIQFYHNGTAAATVVLGTGTSNSTTGLTINFAAGDTYAWSVTTSTTAATDTTANVRATAVCAY